MLTYGDRLYNECVATAEAFEDILCNGQDDEEAVRAAVFGDEYPVAAVLAFGSRGSLRDAIDKAGGAGADERAFALWWLAEEVAAGRCVFGGSVENLS